MKLIGDVDGKTVVESRVARVILMCRLRQAGAARIVGCDISDRMIGLAREREASQCFGHRIPGRGCPVDLAAAGLRPRGGGLAARLRPRPSGARADARRGLARRLRPGGRFVTMTTNPGLYDFRPLPDYRKYGFEVQLADRFSAAPIRLTFHLDDSSLEIENYYLPGSAYESCSGMPGSATSSFIASR